MEIRVKVLYKRNRGKTITCLACNHYCKIKNEGFGICKVRQNREGKLKVLVDGWATGVSPDPIEKKPLYHFLPETRTLSFGTLGCNMGCLNCQNWKQSQGVKIVGAKRKLIRKLSFKISPEQIVNLAFKMKCPSISYTYNEPTVFVEYAVKTMKIAKEAGIKNIWVTNGYFSDETRKVILPYLDAANIDLKSGEGAFYKKVCGAEIEPVMNNIIALHKAGVWVEVTTLIIPGENDKKEELTRIAEFLAGISKKIAWHVTAFHPDYQMTDKECTPKKTLIMAKEIGKKAGLKWVHIGNI